MLRYWAVAAGLLSAGCGGPVVSARLIEANPAAGIGQATDAGLASDPKSGDLLLSFVGGSDQAGWQLYFTRSSDGGEHWSGPLAVTADSSEVHPHGEASPRLVPGPGGRIALIWPRNIAVAGRQWPANQIRFARSLDGGRSWSAPVTINDDSAGVPIGHNFQGAAWQGDSGFVAAWLDERGAPDGEAAPKPMAAMSPAAMEEHNHDQTSEPDARIYAVASPDFGTTWGPNQRVWGAVCPCCRVTLVRAPDGSVRATWRRHYPGNIRDVVVSRLVGADSAPVRVRQDNWVYPGCPHAGPALAIDAEGRSQVAWYTGKEGAAGVFLARSDEHGVFGPAVTLVKAPVIPPAHTALAATAGAGSLVAWDVNAKGKRGIELTLVGPAATTAKPVALKGAEGGSYPQLALQRDNSAVLVWSAGEGDGRRIGLARVHYR